MGGMRLMASVPRSLWLLVFAVVGCDSRESGVPQPGQSASRYESLSANASDGSLRSPETYRRYGPPVEFHGYPCTVDCSGHEAGYAWAEEHDIDDPDDCDGNSDSFIEGCRAYAEEQVEANGDDEDSEEARSDENSEE